MSTPTAPTRRGGARLALLLALIAAVVVVYLTSRARPTSPYDIDSAAPDGYRAIAELARQHGARAVTIDASRLDPEGDGPSATDRIADTIVVPLTGRLDAAHRDGLEAAARGGATVVLGQPFSHAADEPDPFAELVPSARELADTEAVPAARGVCDIASLDGLSVIDAAFAYAPVEVAASERSCFGDGTSALVTERSVGDGHVVTVADPTLFANARLQPAKESGGDPLDNAALALRLMEVGTDAGMDLAFVDPASGGSAPVGGTRDPVDLLPLPVKLALVQGAVAVVLYLWWRGRRLGRPVSEPLPVEIAASELVAAVGDLLRRRGSAERAAATMRHDTRRLLSARLGIPPGAPPDALVERVAEATARPPDEVAAALLDPGPRRGGTPVHQADALVRLAGQLDSIRQEVLDDQPVR